MGLFRTSDGIISQAMPLTAAMIASIDQRPAWFFENQSGTLGTNLNSSVIYCGVMPTDGTGSISVILPGVSSTGVFGFTLTNAGTEYATANNVATTSDTGNGSGLTLDIVAIPAAFSGPVGGDGAYAVGTINTFVPALAGASGTIDSITTIGAPTALTLTQGGIGYDETLPYTYATTVSPTGGTGLTISVTGTSTGSASFTGPTGGNLAYVVSFDSDGFPTTDLISTTFSPAGAVGTITTVNPSGSSNFLDDAGVPTAITITSGLDSYADGTVVEILQTLAAAYQSPQRLDISSGGAPSGATQIVLDMGYALGSNYGPGNPVIMETSYSDNGKIPSGTTITAISANRRTITISAATTGASSYGDALAVTSTTAFGSTFTVVAGATGTITTFAIDNPGSGYDVGDIVSPTLIGAGTPASFSVATLSTTGNPATVTLTGIDGYTVGQEVELRQSAGTTFTGVTPAGPFPSPTTDLYMTSAQQTVQVGDAVTTTPGGIFAVGTTITQVFSQTQFVISDQTIGEIPASTTITFTRVVGTPASGSKITITESANVVASATVGNNAGVNYSVGDVITIAQAGSDLNATLVVSKRALKPLVSQAVTFTGLQSGSILPVSVDYVTAVGGGGVTVDNFIVGR